MLETNISKVLTVIIPSYNVEPYIRRNLDSIVSVSCLEHIEVIAVNDGSTDGTLAVIREYERKYPSSILVIDKPNGHYGSCVNAALAIAKGKYFRILDADDWFDPKALETFVSALLETDADLVVTQRVEVTCDAGGHEHEKFFPLKKVEFGKLYDAKTFLISAVAEGVEFNMHSMTYKTGVLRAVGLRLPEGICYTDMIYCLLPIGSINNLMMLDIYLYHYFVGREGSSTTDQSIKCNFAHICKVLAFMVDYVQGHPADTGTVRDNQMRWIDEASGFFFASLRKQAFVRRADYPYIRAIVSGWKALGFTSRTYRKYYFRLWLALNTRLSLNLCLCLYRVGHPLK